MSLVQDIPLHPWSKLVTDLFHFESASYLLIGVYTSKFPVVCKLSSITWQHVANQCKLIFSEYGLPDILISDNGPCYTEEPFTSVMIAYHVNHFTSSPHYPQPNKLAAKYVQIVKSLFYKAKEEGKDLFKCLMIYHNIPLSGSLQALMQILQSRRARSDLPMSNASRQQLGLQSKMIRNLIKHEHLPSHDLHIGARCQVSGCNKQAVVSIHYYQLMCAAKKLQQHYIERCHLQEDTSLFEALPTTKQGVRR